MDNEKVVRVFDENDQQLGEMSLYEARSAAEAAEKDVVLRNIKTTPPVVKIMNYKKELLKRLFKKLGKGQDEKDMRSKELRLTTNMAFHDLDNRKKQTHGFLKTHQIVKVYMKVNIYDSENIQKGRMMLLNMAEDLKEYCRIKVQPSDPRKRVTETAKGQRKPQDMASIEKAADKQRKAKEEDLILNLDDDPDFDEEDVPDYLYMELRSTASFGDIDIDAMVEMTTLDEFMSGIFQQKAKKSGSNLNAFDKMMADIVSQKDEGPQLEFGKQERV